MLKQKHSFLSAISGSPLSSLFACPQQREPTTGRSGRAGRDGIADEAGLPTEWSESKGIVWKAAIPSWGCSTPAIWNDAIFLTSQTTTSSCSLCG